MADPTNRLAMFSAPVADQVNMLAPQLPAGHPSNLLMWVRDQIPEYHADDSSLASGITSRLKRTGTAIPRAGLETMANWLQGTHDPNAVRIGEDTIAPLGLGAFAGFAGKAMAPSRDVQIAQRLMQQYPDEIAVGKLTKGPMTTGVHDSFSNNYTSHPNKIWHANSAPYHHDIGIGGRPDPAIYAVADNVNTRGPHLLADNAKSSVPGVVVSGMAEQPQTIRAYHGTNARFDKFDPSKTNEAGFHFGTEPQANARRESHGSDGWFSRWRNIPVDIEASRILDLKGDPGWFGGTALARHLHKEGIMPAEVVTKVRQMEAKDLNGANKFVREWLVDQGYDLVRYPNRVEGGGDFSYMALGTGNVRNADTGKVMFADNAKSSVPGVVVSAMGDRSLTELTDAPPRFRPDRAVAATENNPYVVRQGGRDGTNYFALDDAGQPIGYATATTHPIGVKIEGVEVAKGHRGQGVASNLYDTIEQATGQPVRPSGLLTDDSLRLWQSRDPEAVQWHQSLPSEPGWNYSPRELKRMADDRGHVGAREAFDRLPPEARTPERLATMFADNAKSSVPGTVVNAMGEQPQGIRAYHGSPYDFDKFDISKVGTGEGGKPEFGSGLYFAEKEAVARQYRDDISDMHEVPKGHMYEVNIRADPNKMIDMDIPLDRQPEGARNAILSTRETIARREAEKRGIHPELIDEYVKQYMDSEFRSETKLAIRDFDSPYRTNILSDAIKKHGVPGIRYYDGMSRQSGSGTRNYVIFDDSLIDINRKYARNDIASSPGLAANATQEDSPVLDILSKYGLY